MSLRAATTAGLVSLALSGTALAKPNAPLVFCEIYPEAPTCLAGTPACTTCHASSPPERNLFGRAVEAALLPGTMRPLSDADFMRGLPAALAAEPDDDADADGYTNCDEILAGTQPGDALSLPDVRNSITDDCLLFAEWDDLIQSLCRTHRAGTQVAVFPCASMQVEAN